MDWRTPLLILISVTEVWSLSCLQCKGISQPRHCKIVDDCYPGEVCGIEKVKNTLGESLYNIGCITESKCKNVSLTQQNNDECRECCRFDLCNAQGCGEPGYPQTKGPICYSCPSQTNPDTCHNIAFCEPGDLCKYAVLKEFGDTVYTSECSTPRECKDSYQQGIAIVGRDLTNAEIQNDTIAYRRSLTEHVCSGCCNQDLCNKECNGTTLTTDHCTSSPCQHGRCENTGNGFRCVCDTDFTGATCDTHIGLCFNNPCAHGKCYENQEGFICVCDVGYEGRFCDNNTDHCRSNPCVHGTCISTRSNYTCSCTSGFAGPTCDHRAIATDCYDIYNLNVSQKTGVYNVTLWRSKQTIQVYCDMDTFPYGWTVFQKRIDGSVDFYRNFNEYTNGFGNLHGEFWLGLRFVEEMASQYESDIGLDLTAADNSHVYEHFKNFSLSGYPSFTLHIERHAVQQTLDGTYGIYYGIGSNFSTFDNDQDTHTPLNCAELYHSGWWHRDCGQANLNGEYMSPPGTRSSFYGGEGGFTYYSWKKTATLKSSKIMVRKHTG